LNYYPPQQSNTYSSASWQQTPFSPAQQQSTSNLKSPMSNSSSTTASTSKNRKRKNSDQQSVGKKPPSKRQAKQEKQQPTPQQTPPQRPPYPSNSYYGQQSDYMYPSPNAQNPQYYGQQRQPSPRNLVYAPTVSIPPANGPQTSNAMAYGQAQQNYNYLAYQSQYPTYPGAYPPPNAAYYPPQATQYQQGFLAPPQLIAMDPNRLSPRPKSQNSNPNVTRTNSPQVAALSPAQQPSVKIPQMQPPNYPYPPQNMSYPSPSTSTNPVGQAVYPQQQQYWNGPYSQQQRMGRDILEKLFGAGVYRICNMEL
jgi:hypothetical protein